MIWEKVHPATAALHAGDWLLKLVLIASPSAYFADFAAITIAVDLRQRRRSVRPGVAAQLGRQFYQWWIAA